MRKHFLVFATTILVGWPSPAMAQDVVEFTSSVLQVSQDFNSMWDNAAGDATLDLPDGWRVERNLTSARTLGSYSNASTAVMYSGGTSLASNASNGTWNFGASAALEDRAVGGLSTTVSNGTRCINVMVHLHNSGEEAITKLTIGYGIEKYRNGDNAAGFAVQLYSSPDGSAWSSAGNDFYTFFTPDGATEGSATVPISTTTVSGKQLKVDIPAGKDLYLAWNISVASGSSPNKAMGLAIDDVIIDATFASQDQAAYIYVEDVTKWSALYMNGILPTSSSTINGVGYKVWEMVMDGESHTLEFSNGNGKSVSKTITANRDYYLCLTADEVTEIDDGSIPHVRLLWPRASICAAR